MHGRLKEPSFTLLEEILNRIENKSHLCRDPADGKLDLEKVHIFTIWMTVVLFSVNFFRSAMEYCCRRIKDVDLAYRVNKLLHYGNNYELLGNNFNRVIY